ncbi:MAG: sigma-70 family RNA polymerase sigma factor [Saprospiraceae bacterium]|nr:sigma-70 family RNA polymerase sigma factor [Saprospiraceae bacterium]MBK9564037.1 sigma-70 family RNA polymerase sigma factor [Saprospiraceae bacterium]MBP6445427.1 sigma-70 family RNA polymerase sigma factor [Saprospiraceae bacterium]
MHQKPFEEKTDFEIIFKEYFNPLVNFVNKYLENYENSREVVQSTFVKIWQYKNQIEIKTSVKAYLYQMTKNTMIDFIRSNKSMVSASLVENEMLLLQDTTVEHLDPYIVRQAFELAMIDLKDKPREIFRLNKFEGLTYEEIADYLNVSKRSVEDNVAKVSNHLKEKLKNHSYFFE